MRESLLAVDQLDVDFHLKEGDFNALKQISFSIYPNEVVGIVGESGCGKSLTSQAIMGILPPNASIKKGSIYFQGKEITALTEKEWQQIRGNDMSMIFQEPMTALNPLLTIGKQIAEVLKRHQSLSKQEEKQQTISIMKEVGLPRPEALYKSYPHQLSGGMRQRVVIAIALIGQPDLIIADEPTTALDVTIQSQILDLFKRMKETRKTSMLFISHDWGVIRQICDRVLVMYAGHIVEEGKMDELIHNAKHPYTQSLLQSIPDFQKRGKQLYSIPGSVPDIKNRKQGCPFADRCASRLSICSQMIPEFYSDDRHRVACHLYQKGVSYSDEDSSC